MTDENLKNLYFLLSILHGYVLDDHECSETYKEEIKDKIKMGQKFLKKELGW